MKSYGLWLNKDLIEILVGVILCVRIQWIFFLEKPNTPIFFHSHLSAIRKISSRSFFSTSLQLGCFFLIFINNFFTLVFKRIHFNEITKNELKKKEYGIKLCKKNKM